MDRSRIGEEQGEFAAFFTNLLVCFSEELRPNAGLTVPDMLYFRKGGRLERWSLMRSK